MSISPIAIIAGAVASFVFGAIWYMPLFGNLWRKIHNFDKLSKKDQEIAQKEMMPYLGVQFLMTLITSFVLAGLIKDMPTVPAYKIVGATWFGFLLPAYVSSVMFGGTEKKWMTKKIFVLAAESLIRLQLAAWIIRSIQG